MPYQQPQSLTDDEVYAVTAYLFRLNGIVPDDAVMNAQTLPQVKMPNRDNFIRMDPQRAPRPRRPDRHSIMGFRLRRTGTKRAVER